MGLPYLGTASLTQVSGIRYGGPQKFDLTRPILLQRVKVGHPVVNSATEQLRSTSQAIKQPQYPPLHSVFFVRLQRKEVVSSTVILEMQATWISPSTTVSTVAIAQLQCRLN